MSNILADIPVYCNTWMQPSTWLLQSSGIWAGMPCVPDPALAKFLNAELARRAWTKKDFARALKPFDISQSAAYLILRGEDNVRRDTSEAIAAALGMTPAELWVAVYRPRDLTAAQIAASTAIERMPAENARIAR